MLASVKRKQFIGLGWGIVRSLKNIKKTKNGTKKRIRLFDELFLIVRNNCLIVVKNKLTT